MSIPQQYCALLSATLLFKCTAILSLAELWSLASWRVVDHTRVSMSVVLGIHLDLTHRLYSSFDPQIHIYCAYLFVVRSHRSSPHQTDCFSGVVQLVLVIIRLLRTISFDDFGSYQRRQWIVTVPMSRIRNCQLLQECGAFTVWHLLIILHFLPHFHTFSTGIYSHQDFFLRGFYKNVELLSGRFFFSFLFLELFKIKGLHFGVKIARISITLFHFCLVFDHCLSIIAQTLKFLLSFQLAMYFWSGFLMD